MKVRVAGVIKEGNRVLTLRYNYGGVDVFALPGGNLEFGEELKEALKREYFEEIQIDIKVGEELLTAEVIREGEQTLHQIFECSINKGVPILNPAETTSLEVCWLEIDRIKEYNLYPNINIYLGEIDLANKYVGVIEQKWF
ncbi:NUDIX domain-containing protein [Arcticibacterium luteifluviistationis]|uniref:NUDIX hydrolase n=1 Tax=Arcticibacterium luteifluviistationis TaxID=1784714 RepID=A0A2Z4GFI6_9BACT|nr:NUDIX domain-containing protein [Arcticibacterium luteifluviistationis]AWV99738.1 NUDIX hydrolase [Arcticibacterium luteifluviistationis]